jgi:predicted membrane protein
MSFVRFLGTIAIVVNALRMTSIFGYEEQWGWLLTTVWCVSAANDFTITTALVANLISHRSHIHKRY